METMRRFFAIVLADARQRWRTPRLRAWLLVLVAATWFCFPAADAGYRVLGIGPFRTGYSSAWAGMVVAMLMSWLSLVGFFLVRGTLTRDIESRCWELLVATPLSRVGYLLAKAASHLLVLAALAAGMLVVAAIAVLVRGEATGLQPSQLLLPMLWLGLPALAVCATCAVLFDLVPLLRRTLGNGLYVVLWVAMLASASSAGRDGGSPWHVGDVHGIAVFKRDLAAAATARADDAAAMRVCMVCGSAAGRAQPLAWPAWAPRAGDLPGRLFWLLLPLPVLALAARGLDRAAAVHRTSATSPRRPRPLRWLRRLLAPWQRLDGTALVALELQHALRERSGWAWAALVLAWSLQAFAAPAVAGLAVIAAWATFLPLFAGAALREREYGTAAVVFSGAGAATRLLRVRAGLLVLVALAAAAPALVRFAAEAPMAALALAMLAASLPAWSLALGAASGSARPFEASFVLAAGLALNGVAVLDVVPMPATTLLAHAAALPLALLLLGVAWPRASRA